MGKLRPREATLLTQAPRWTRAPGSWLPPAPRFGGASWTPSRADSITPSLGTASPSGPDGTIWAEARGETAHHLGGGAGSRARSSWCVPGGSPRHTWLWSWSAPGGRPGRGQLAAPFIPLATPGENPASLLPPWEVPRPSFLLPSLWVSADRPLLPAQVRRSAPLTPDPLSVQFLSLLRSEGLCPKLSTCGWSGRQVPPMKRVELSVKGFLRSLLQLTSLLPRVCPDSGPADLGAWAEPAHPTLRTPPGVPSPVRQWTGGWFRF